MQGTIPYLAPEQVLAAAMPCEYDPRKSDVWAAGVTLLACLFGAGPFEEAASRGLSGSSKRQRTVMVGAAAGARSQSVGEWEDAPLGERIVVLSVSLGERLPIVAWHV